MKWVANQKSQNETVTSAYWSARKMHEIYSVIFINIIILQPYKPQSKLQQKH